MTAGSAEMAEQFVPEVFAHGAVDKDAERRVERHQEAGDHVDERKPERRVEATDSAHVDVLAAEVARQGVEEGGVVVLDHVAQLVLLERMHFNFFLSDNLYGYFMVK